MTSSNYNDNEKKVTGGRNGFGAKLANIFSTKFVIETADSTRHKKYRQVFKNNMSDKEDPHIEGHFDGNDFTCITFYPDLKKFKMDSMDNDIVSLMSKRAYDLAGCTSKKVRVYLNGKKIEINDFNEYCDLYLKTEENKELPKMIEKKHERWEIIASLSDGEFK